MACLLFNVPFTDALYVILSYLMPISPNLYQLICLPPIDVTQVPATMHQVPPLTTVDTTLDMDLFTRLHLFRLSCVVDLAVSDHYCVFFSVTGFIQQETTVTTVRKHYITS